MKEMHCISGEKILVDDDDYEYLNSYNWYFHKSDGYAYRNIEKKRHAKRIQMHRDLVECPNGFVTDHINRNKLDNRKKNLRVVEHYVNSQNKKLPSNNNSGYVGVWFNGKKYIAEIRHKCKKFYLGSFNHVEEAALAYNKKVDELKSFHRKNIIKKAEGD